jgi:hypothetical protein
MATQNDIRRWLIDAKNKNIKYLIVVCDTFDHVDYPVNCMTDEECLEKYSNPGDMQRIMEVYDLNMDIESQLNQNRVFNLPKN